MPMIIVYAIIIIPIAYYCLFYKRGKTVHATLKARSNHTTETGGITMLETVLYVVIAISGILGFIYTISFSYLFNALACAGVVFMCARIYQMTVNVAAIRRALESYIYESDEEAENSASPTVQPRASAADKDPFPGLVTDKPDKPTKPGKQII